jgi:ribosomal protein S7
MVQKKNITKSNKVLKISLKLKFINFLMRKGKKYRAEKLLTKGFELLQQYFKKDSRKILLFAIINHIPFFKFHTLKKRRKRRTPDKYFPSFIIKQQRILIAIKWLIKSAQIKGFSTSINLFYEILIAAQNEGKSIRQLSLYNDFICSIKGLSHYRWF